MSYRIQAAEERTNDKFIGGYKGHHIQIEREEPGERFGYMKRREVPEAPAKCSLFPIPHPDQFIVARRIFELALNGHSVVEIRSRLIDAFPDRPEHIPAHSTIDDALRDSFFCGQWAIRPGTKFERIINLREIVLPDGTTFQPIVTPDEFARLQTLRGNKRTRPSGKIGRRVNPFPGLIHCAACGRKMYPGYRKIQRANKAREEQLGYECHTRHDDGTRCPQGRIASCL